MDPSQLLEVLNLTEEAVSVIGVLIGALIYLIIKDRQCTQRRDSLQERIQLIEDRHAETIKWMLQSFMQRNSGDAGGGSDEC